VRGWGFGLVDRGWGKLLDLRECYPYCQSHIVCFLPKKKKKKKRKRKNIFHAIIYFIIIAGQREA